MSTRTSDDQRPLSPHLQIYRWEWTMAGSILHRISGLLLSAGMVLVTVWLVALAAGPDAFGRVQGVLATPVAIALLVGWTLALFYHLLNGIRHLFWDAGMMLDLGPARASAIAVAVTALVLTAVVWLVPMIATAAAAPGGVQ
ncbi:succinate dehydrogenase, cytochrome b556 subunit [Halomonas denitrificans]|nr:succinate dehydrogenase, cytochrome b556 subunit [Halomonas denitrificans]